MKQHPVSVHVHRRSVQFRESTRSETSTIGFETSMIGSETPMIGKIVSRVGKISSRIVSGTGMKPRMTA